MSPTPGSDEPNDQDRAESTEPQTSSHSARATSASYLDDLTGPTCLLPLFPLGTVLVPAMELSLHVFEPRYRQLVADLLGGANAEAPEFGVVALRQGWEVGELKDLHQVGTAALVSDVVPLSDGRCNLAAVGRRRFVIRSVDATSRPYLQAQVHFLPEQEGVLRPGAADLVRYAAQRHAAVLEQLGVQAEESDSDLPDDTRALSYAIARQPGLTLADRQAILAAPDTAARLSTARNVLLREYELVRRLRAIPVNASNFRPAASD